MEQRDNKFQNSETRNYSQGQERNQLKGHDNNQQTGGISFIVRKAEKLTTALYMVTDIMSEKEPMKWKARESGVELLSDMMVLSSSGSSEVMTILRNATKKIEQIVSFLDVAQSTRMMSEMNASVLKKEYITLKDACLTEWQRISDGSKNIFTQSFFEVPRQIEQDSLRSEKQRGDRDGQDGLRSGLSLGRPDLGEAVHLGNQPSEKNLKDSTSEEVVRLPIAPQKISQGQTREHYVRVPEHKQFPKTTREDSSRSESQDGLRSGLGFERPDLSEVVRPNVPETKNVPTTSSPVLRATSPASAPSFIPRATVSPSGIIERPRQDVGRDDRRKIILALIKQKPSLTVKDIARSIPGVSEKTIQRELFAMVGDGVLTKKGDRRWSTYSLAV